MSDKRKLYGSFDEAKNYWESEGYTLDTPGNHLIRTMRDQKFDVLFDDKDMPKLEFELDMDIAPPGVLVIENGNPKNYYPLKRK